MKKFILTVSLGLVSLSIFSPINAQMASMSGMSGGGDIACQTDAFDILRGCLSDNGITFTLVEGTTTASLYCTGSYPPGQLTSCISHYNNAANDCSSAATIVMVGAKTRQR